LTWYAVGSGSGDGALCSFLMMHFRFTVGLSLLLRDDDFDEETFVEKLGPGIGEVSTASAFSFYITVMNMIIA